MSQERGPRRRLRAILARVPRGRLARNTIYSTVGLAFRAMIQAAYLILLSRRMGSSDYGLFAGSVAIAVLLAPLSGWGISYVLAQQVSRHPTRARALWATALVQIGLSGFALTLIVMLASMTALTERIGLTSMLMLAIAELVALPAVQVATTLCVVEGRGAAAACLICLVPAARLAAVSAFLISGGEPAPGHVAAFHFIGSLAGFLMAVAAIARIEGAPAWSGRLPVRNATADGSQYALGALVGTSYPEIDKVLLLQLASTSVVGTYTAAFRVMGVLLLPITALASNALPRLFASQSAHERAHTLRAVTIAATAYGIVAAIGANLLAPFMPDIFGVTFAESSRYLELLSVWVVLFALHQCAAIGLTGSGRQWLRIAVEGAGVVVIVMINLTAIPVLGGRGSVLALLAAETLMAAACWTLLRGRATHTSGR